MTSSCSDQNQRQSTTMTAPPIPDKSPLRNFETTKAAVPTPLSCRSGDQPLSGNVDDHYEALSNSIDEVLQLVQTQASTQLESPKHSLYSASRSVYSSSMYSQDLEDDARSQFMQSSRSSIDSSRSSHSTFSFDSNIHPAERTYRPSKAAGSRKRNDRFTREPEYFPFIPNNQREYVPRVRNDDELHADDLEPLPIMTTDQMFDMIEHIPRSYKPGHHKKQFEEDAPEFSFRPSSACSDSGKTILGAASSELRRSGSLQRSFVLPGRKNSLRFVVQKIRSRSNTSVAGQNW